MSEPMLDDDLVPDGVGGPKGAEQFIADSRVEKLLNGRALTFELVVVDLADIDLTPLERDLGPDRQMRDDVIHPDVARRYGDDLTWGAQFPAGVLSRSGKTYRIVDFHHRLWGAREAKLDQVTAYVVEDLDDFDLVELGNILNRDHGVPLTEHERLRQALWGLDIGRFKSAREAARILGLREAIVGKHKRIHDGKQRAQRELGVAAVGFERLPDTSQDRLAGIASPQIFKEAAHKVINKGLGVTEVNELIKAVNEAPTDAEKIEVVRSFANDIEPKKTGLGLNDPLTRIHAACRSLLVIELGDSFDYSLSQRSPSDMAVLRAEIDETSARLVEIRSRLSNPVTP